MQKTEPLHIQAIDLLRITSILAVVLVHSTTKTLDLVKYDLAHVQWTLFLNQAARFAVPMFFLISGFVLELNFASHSSYWAYLKKRVSRVLVPYLVWSLIYYFFVYHDAENLLAALLDGSSSYQLYFIPSLLIFYLIFPLLHKYYQLITKRRVFILLGLLQIFLLYQDYYKHSIVLYYPLSVVLFNYYVFIIGMAASHKQEYITAFVKKYKYLFIPATLALAGFLFWEGKDLYLQTHNYLSIYSQWRPGVLIYTLILAALLYYFFSLVKPFYLIKLLSRLSFFVFFVHVAVVEIFWKQLGSSLYTQFHRIILGEYIFDPLVFVVIATVSFTIAFVVSKIPFLSKITG